MNLITRTDLDGVTCAVFITTMEDIGQVIYAEPNDIDDGSVRVYRGDAIANLPFHTNAALWFDQHDKAEEQPDAYPAIRGKRGVAPSTARLVYEFYNSPQLERYEPMLNEVDRVDSASLTREDILDPREWILLAFTLDPFMGLKAFHSYANAMVAAIKGGAPIEQILEIPEVRGRVNRYLADAKDFREELERATNLTGNVIVTNFRDVEVLPSGNRFLAFTMHPEGNVQVVLTDDKERGKVRVRIGKSLFNKTCRVHLGKLTAEFGGGGLSGAAGCLLDPSVADAKLAEIVGRLQKIA
jgi:hypothetical protein